LQSSKQDIHSILLHSRFFLLLFLTHTITMTSDNNSNPSIPVMNQPVNMMDVGANGNNLAAAAMQRHPVEVLQQRQGSYSCAPAFVYTLLEMLH
jgi:hypothetical protein